jgi:hypothetical protein
MKEQMGHSSIQVTVDTYGHSVPGANVSYVDRLDKKPSSKPAARRQQHPQLPLNRLVAVDRIELSTYGL